MTGTKIIQKIFYSSWFLASIPAALVIYLLPQLGTRYIVEIEKPSHLENGAVYVDLNHDSISERVATSRGGTYFFVNIRNSDNHFFDQWNLQDSLYPDISELYFGDYDHNGLSEVYVFSHSYDSLFLNINEILNPTGIKYGHKFITRIGYRKGEVACNVRFTGFYDADGDGHDELYFTISSYYRLGTRGLFYYDIARQKVSESQSVGSIFIKSFLKDVDNDGIPEIYGNLSASGNYPANTPISDSSNWLMVYNPNLLFKFPPVEFPGFANSLAVLPYKNNEFAGYLLLLEVNGANSALQSTLMLYTKNGKEVRRRLLKEFTSKSYATVFAYSSFPDDRIFVSADKLYELNKYLDVRKSVKLPYKSAKYVSLEDLTGDGKKELLIYFEAEHKLVVYDSSLEKLAEAPLDVPILDWRTMTYMSPLHEYKLYLSSGDKGYLLKLRKNKYYYLAFPAYPAIYFSLYLFIVLIKNIGNAQQKSREDLNNRLITLQLQGIKAQLDPHFTFNTLNSIASLIYLEDRQSAYDYMRKFTELLRSMLNDAEKIYRNLGDEIEFVTTYLELEKLRFGEKFDFRIEIGESVTLKEQVPKLVLQTFAENAVKHGIMSKEEGGLIVISAVRDRDFLRLIVEDNGIGRERSAGQSKSTGRGLKLTNEFYDILNQINKKPIRLQITDMHDGTHNPTGTRIEVWVPLDEVPFQLNR